MLAYEAARNILMRRDTVIERLIGAWDFEQWFETKSDGAVDYSGSEGWSGKLIYTADGHVSAQLVRGGITRFTDDDYRNATAAESATAWQAYFGYFGTWSLDVERQTIIHHIEGAWFPNLIGTDQLRRYRFEGKRLLLQADVAWGRVGAAWKRAAAQSAELT